MLLDKLACRLMNPDLFGVEQVRLNTPVDDVIYVHQTLTRTMLAALNAQSVHTLDSCPRDCVTDWNPANVLLENLHRAKVLQQCAQTATAAISGRPTTILQSNAFQRVTEWGRLLVPARAKVGSTSAPRAAVRMMWCAQTAQNARLEPMFRVRAMAGSQTYALAAALAIFRLRSSSLPAPRAKQVTMQQVAVPRPVPHAQLESILEQEMHPAGRVRSGRSPALQHLPSAQHVPTERMHPVQAQLYVRHAPEDSINRSSSLPLASPVHLERLQVQRARRCAAHAARGRMLPRIRLLFAQHAPLAPGRTWQEAMHA